MAKKKRAGIVTQGGLSAELAKRSKPRLQPGINRPVLDTLTVIVIWLAAIAAVTVSGVAIVAIGWPKVFDIFVPQGADYRSNLVVEAVFFWIELAAIIVGMRALDRFLSKSNRQLRAIAIARKLGEVEREIVEFQTSFVGSLDRNAQNGAFPGAQFQTIPERMRDVRNDLRIFMIRLENTYSVEGRLIHSCLDEFDQIVRDTARLAAFCASLNSTLAAGVAVETKETTRAQLLDGIR
ncbi:MAG: hypothetical protein ABL932_25730, partial [Terricaulis sp.]